MSSESPTTQGEEEYLTQHYPDELHHYPRSFTDILRRSQAKQEQFKPGAHQGLELQIRGLVPVTDTPLP